MQYLDWFVIVSTIGFWGSVLYRITHPYKCTCEASFFLFGSYRKHVNLKHGVA